MKLSLKIEDLSVDKIDQLINSDILNGGGSAAAQAKADDSFKIILGDSWGFTFTNCDNSSGTGNNMVYGGGGGALDHHTAPMARALLTFCWGESWLFTITNLDNSSLTGGNCGGGC